MARSHRTFLFEPSDLSLALGVLWGTLVAFSKFCDLPKRCSRSFERDFNRLLTNLSVKYWSLDALTRWQYYKGWDDALSQFIKRNKTAIDEEKFIL